MPGCPRATAVAPGAGARGWAVTRVSTQVVLSEPYRILLPRLVILGRRLTAAAEQVLLCHRTDKAATGLDGLFSFRVACRLSPFQPPGRWRGVETGRPETADARTPLSPPRATGPAVVAWWRPGGDPSIIGSHRGCRDRRQRCGAETTATGRGGTVGSRARSAAVAADVAGWGRGGRQRGCETAAGACSPTPVSKPTPPLPGHRICGRDSSGRLRCRAARAVRDRRAEKLIESLRSLGRGAAAASTLAAARGPSCGQGPNGETSPVKLATAVAVSSRPGALGPQASFG